MPQITIALNAADAVYDWYFDEEEDGTVTFTIEDQVELKGSREDVAALLEQMLEEVK